MINKIAEQAAEITKLKEAATAAKAAATEEVDAIKVAHKETINQLKQDSKVREHRAEVTQVTQAKWVLYKAKIRGSLYSMVICMNVFAGIAIPALDWAQHNFFTLREFLPKELYATSFILIIVMNLGLRFFRTNTPLEEKI